MDDDATSILHACPLCHIQFSSKTAFYLHFAEQHDKIKKEADFLMNERKKSSPTVVNCFETKRFLCQQCSFITKTEKLLAKHEQTQHNPQRKVYSCHLCLYSCLQERTFHLHQIKHSKVDAKFACDQCGKLFLSMGIMKRHTLTHSKSKHFICGWENCGKSFNIKSRLTDHVRSVHKSRTECGKDVVSKNNRNVIMDQKSKITSATGKDLLLNTFVKKESYTTLQGQTNGGVEINCENEFFSDDNKIQSNLTAGVSQGLCSEALDNSSSKSKDSSCETNELDDNLISVYDIVLPERASKASNRSFQIEEKREISFEKPTTRKDNKTIISKFACSWLGCAKVFRDRYNLRMHMFTHTRQMQRECNLCGYSCVQKSALDKHMKRHLQKNLK